MSYADAFATEPHLAAHVIRGEMVFDVAHKLCEGAEPCQPHCGIFPRCKESPFWIIRSTGHRIHPYWTTPLIPLIIALEGWQVALPDFTAHDLTDIFERPKAPRPTTRPSLSTLEELF